MANAWLHRTAALLAVLTLLLLIAGALVTGPTPVASSFTRGVHRVFAAGVGLLTLGVAVMVWTSDRRGWMRAFATALVVAVGIQGWLGAMSARAALPPWVSVFHASLAHVFFTGTMVLSNITSTRWSRGPSLVPDAGWPSMRTLATVTPVLVLVQVVLGAGYRHGAITVLPHVVGAVVIGFIILTVALFAVTQFGSHRVLRGSGIHLLGVASVQILFGIAAYIVRVTYENPGTTPGWAIAVPILHVATGAMTLAAATVLSVQILRNVQARDRVSSEAVPVSEQ